MTLEYYVLLLRFLLPGLIGIPLGVTALAMLDPKILKLGISGFMVLYGSYFSMRKSLPKFEHPTPFVDSIVGFSGGILGGAASLSGALPTMWCSMRPWPKSEIRAVLQPFNVIILGLTAAVFALKGTYTWESIKIIGIALPVTMIFAQIGISVFKRLADDQFRRLLITMMFASGVILMIREFL